MLASDIIDRARVVLNDADATRWLNDEFFKWINDGQRVIVMVRPDASVANEPVNLVAGTKQSIPGTGLRLLDVIRNVGASPGNAGGRAVRIVDREVLDTQNPNWHADTGATTIKNFIYDNRDAKNFYVYPPAAVGARVEIIYSKVPTNVTAISDNLSVDDIYTDALLNYVLFRAYSKDAEFAQNMQLSSSYLGIFNSMLGIKTQKDVAYSPDLNSKGAMPSPALQAGGV